MHLLLFDGIVENNQTAALKLGKKVSKIEIFILARRSQGKSVFSPNSAYCVNFKLWKLIPKYFGYRRILCNGFIRLVVVIVYSTTEQKNFHAEGVLRV